MTTLGIFCLSRNPTQDLMLVGRGVIADFVFFVQSPHLILSHNVLTDFVANPSLCGDLNVAHADCDVNDWKVALEQTRIHYSCALKRTRLICPSPTPSHHNNTLVLPQKKRNKAAGFCDAERENFGLLVGGDGNEITDEQRAKRYAKH
jgi:hypothetical protein